MRIRISLLVFFAIIAVRGIHGQSPHRQQIQVLTDSLAKLGYTMYNEPSEPERLAANFSFVKTLVAALKTPYSYTHPFDSLRMVSILRAPDDRFRIFSWHIQLNDGSYLFYGTIQMNTPDGTLKMYPLLDKTYEIPSPETAISQPGEWYGAQYYRLVKIDENYILLGWKGHTPYVTQKVIEVLQFTDQGVRLGKAIFDGAEQSGHTRAIYRYNRSATMFMDYDSAANRILMDHLAPAEAKDEGQYERYGPDMTYDAWQWKQGRLLLDSDVPLTNLPDSNDDRYNDPRKPQSHPKSGFTIQ